MLAQEAQRIRRELNSEHVHLIDLLEHALLAELDAAAAVDTDQSLSGVPKPRYAYVRDACRDTLLTASETALSRVPLRFAGLILNVMAFTEDDPRVRLEDALLSALAFSLAEDRPSCAALMKQHELDVLAMPPGIRFAVASIEPTLRTAVIESFPDESPERTALTLMEESERHQHAKICTLHDTLLDGYSGGEVEPDSPRELEAMLLQIAQQRVEAGNYIPSLFTRRRTRARS